MVLAAAIGLSLAAIELLVVTAAGLSRWWLLLIPLSAGFGVLVVEQRALHRKLQAVEKQRDDASAELERRISEIFSLRELGYVLSESLQQERIVEQVARYASRFLRADGVMAVLIDGGNQIIVAAAEGTLARHKGRKVPAVDVSLVTAAIERGRIEVDQRRTGDGVRVLADIKTESAAVVPFTVRGERIGALAVVDRQGGAFTTEDLWLLSAVATNASVVLANSRLFALAERGREEWETAFDALREGLALVDYDGRIQRANRALGTLSGDEPAALIGRDFVDLVLPGSIALGDTMREARAGKRPAPLSLSRDHDERLLRVTLTPLSGTFGARAVIALVEDVTEQRALEAQVIQAEKMAAIGQLVSGVAHELNNPLTSIAGLSELLLDTGPLAPAAREHLRIISDQSERAGRIVRNLLTFARRGEPVKLIVDLNDVATRTAALISYELRLRDVELEEVLAGHPVEALGDPFELQQVLLNLMTNAIHAMKDLPAGRRRLLTVQTAVEQDRAVVRVRDTGDGVPIQHVSRLFTPFFTTKAAGQGTGLGLPVSYGIARAHGGALTYAGITEGGAEFTLALPHAAPAQSSGAAARRILVADRDAAVHRLVSALVAPAGHAVDVARVGGEAVQLSNEHEYHLVIADSTLIVEDGIAVLDGVLARRPDWKPRLVSVGQRIGTCPAPRHLDKPLDIKQLRVAIDEVLKSDG